MEEARGKSSVYIPSDVSYSCDMLVAFLLAKIPASVRCFFSSDVGLVHVRISSICLVVSKPLPLCVRQARLS